MKYLYVLMICSTLMFCSTLKAEEKAVSARSSALGGAGATFERGAFSSHFNAASNSRSWEDLAKMEFTIGSSIRFRTHGSSHDQLLRIKDSHNRIKHTFSGVGLNPSNPLSSAQYLAGALQLLDQWEDIKILHGDGFTGGYRADASVIYRDLFLDDDALSLHVSTQQNYGAWLEIDKTNFNFNIRLFHDPVAFLNNIDWYIYQYGIFAPATPEGQTYVKDLLGMGYTPEQAETIAYIIEQSGYAFAGGLSQKMLDALLTNMMNGEIYMDSLEMGANPIEGNKSKLHYRSVAIQSMAVNYSFNIPTLEWLSAGLTAKYIRATQVDLGNLQRGDGINSMLGTQSKPKYNLAFDLGLTVNLSEDTGLFIGLGVKNINAPSFEWSAYTYHMEPQFRLAVGVHPFSTQVPLKIGFDLDLNRVENSLLPGLYEQHFGIGLELAPEWENIGFAFRLGFGNNVGDTGEPGSFTAGVGLTLYDFTLDVSGASSTSNLQGSTYILGFSLPSNLKLVFQFSYKLDF